MFKRMLMLAVGFLLFSGFTLSWDPVTTYTDNTAIEAAKTVTYNVIRGGGGVSLNQTGTSFTFTTGFGTLESFGVQAELSTGEKSEISTYSWTSPLGRPRNPLNLRVAP